jgi:hypothetical protein
MDDWSNSKVTNGYYPVKQQIEKELSTGRQPIFNESSLPSEMENNGAKGEILKMIADNTNALSKVDNTPLSESEANSFAQAFKNENTQFHWLTDNQGSVLLKLNYPGDGNKQDPVKGTFKINPATASFGLLKNLANRTGDSGFMSQIYSNFNLTPNKNYSINDKDGYLASRLGKLFPSADGKVDVKAFKGFKIRYIEDPISKETRYEVTDPQGIAHVATNKIELLEALADYKQNSDAYHQ